MSGNIAVAGVVPIVNILDNITPEINRPKHLIYTKDNSIPSPQRSIFYTLGVIVLSVALFLTLAAWSNVLLSWFDSKYVDPALATITKSRLYFAIILTIISVSIITSILLIWSYFAK